MICSFTWLQIQVKLSSTFADRTHNLYGLGIVTHSLRVKQWTLFNNQHNLLRRVLFPIRILAVRIMNYLYGRGKGGAFYSHVVDIVHLGDNYYAKWIFKIYCQYVIDSVECVNVSNTPLNRLRTITSPPYSCTNEVCPLNFPNKNGHYFRLMLV